MSSDTANRKRLEAIVHGRVQGVNFRHYTRARARQMGLTGYVRNRRDGSVQVVAEGDADDLRALLRWLQHGPPLAEVRRVEPAWSEACDDFERFEVRF